MVDEVSTRAVPAPSHPRSRASYRFGKAGKLVRLIQTVSNWPQTLLDHLRLRQENYICRLRNGVLFEVRAGTDDRHIIFEVWVERCYPTPLPSQRTVVDIGAQIGCFTVMAAQQCEHVFSFEPFPANFEALTRNVAQNGLRNVHAFPLAIGDKHATMQLYLPDNTGDVGRFSLYPGRGNRTIDVPCITLDEVVREHALARIDLLKIDCQGSEYAILYGTSPETWSRIDEIIVECETFEEPAAWSVAGLMDHLERGGFTVANRENLVFASRDSNRVEAWIT